MAPDIFLYSAPDPNVALRDPTQVAGGAAVTGALVSTLAGLVSAETAIETFSGTLAVTLAQTAQAFAAVESLLGNEGATLGGVSPQVAALETFLGTASPSLAGLAQAFTGAEAILGSAAPLLGGLSQAFAGVESILGSLSVSLTGVAEVEAGVEAFPGQLAGTLNSTAASATGLVGFVANLSGALGASALSVDASLSFVGVLATSLTPISQAMTGIVEELTAPPPAESSVLAPSVLRMSAICTPRGSNPVWTPDGFHREFSPGDKVSGVLTSSRSSVRGTILNLGDETFTYRIEGQKRTRRGNIRALGGWKKLV